MTLTVNGNTVHTNLQISLLELLESKGFPMDKIAVELGGDIIAKAKYKTTMLQEGDILEVVTFVGGG